MTRIVIFIDWFAPAYKAGGPIQSIVNLVNQPFDGVEYRIVCSNKDLDGGLLGVSFDTWVPFNEQTFVWYNSDPKNIPALLRTGPLKNADVFFINGIYSFYYNLIPLLLGHADRKIISARGMLHTGALSQKSKKKRGYLAIWKLLRLHRRHSFHATNGEEERFIKMAFGPPTRVHVAQNLPRFIQDAVKKKEKKDCLELISIGLVSPMKNYLNVLQSLKSCSFKTHYHIYGPIKDAVYWKECQGVITQLPENVTVSYHGDLPSRDVPDVLKQSHVFVLPSKSENFGHAIYEALSAGLPVVTSNYTPWNGLEVSKAGFNVSLENNYELSKAICFFAAASSSELRDWSEGAKAYAENAIDIDEIKNQYRQMFQL